MERGAQAQQRRQHEVQAVQAARGARVQQGRQQGVRVLRCLQGPLLRRVLQTFD